MRMTKTLLGALLMLLGLAGSGFAANYPNSDFSVMKGDAGNDPTF